MVCMRKVHSLIHSIPPTRERDSWEDEVHSLIHFIGLAKNFTTQTDLTKNEVHSR